MSEGAPGFFLQDDPRAEHFVFDMPSYWWSRPYEYAWAASFARPGDVVLDAACGVCHPLKFHLLDVCGEVHACDSDPRILSPRAILQEIAEVYGKDTADAFPARYLDKIHYKQCDICNLPHESETFDKIFCISVLEHLEDRFNTSPGLLPFFFALRLFSPHAIFKSLKEFRRALKPDGMIVLTFDYPRINLAYLHKILPILGLHWVESAGFAIPAGALYSKEHDSYCFRALLRKTGSVSFLEPREPGNAGPRSHTDSQEAAK